MRHICPSCKEPGVSGLAKRWSSRGAPAKCETCGGLCHVLASTSSGIGAVGFVIVAVSLIAAIGLHSLLIFASGLVLAVGCNLWAWKRAKLVPISRQSVASAAKMSWVLAGLFVLLGLS